MKIWGEKTIESKSFEKINNIRLVNETKKDISEYLENFIFEQANDDTIKIIDSGINSYLSALKNKNFISNYSNVESSLKLKTWEDLYPKNKERLKARIYYRIANIFKLKYTYEEPNLFTVLFPFKKHEHKTDIINDMKNTWMDGINSYDNSYDYWEENPPSIYWIMDYLQEYKVKIYSSYELTVPYSYTDINLYFRPVEAIEYIVMNMKIEKGVKI